VFFLLFFARARRHTLLVPIPPPRSLTGESDEIRKSADRAPCLLAGTNVTAGTGAFIVTAVGVRTVQGQIIKDSTSDTEETPLQQKLDDLATKIGYIGMGAAVLTFIAMMVIKATNGGTSGGRSWGSWTVTSFIYAITIIVVAIPEGLPLAVTISLAYSTGKMLQDKNLIRHLDACETMGNATDICTDKTGTLTENQMTVVEAWLGGVSLTFASSAVPGSDKAPVLTAPSAVPAVLRDLLRDHLAINSTAAVIEVHAHGRTHEEVRGSKTEGAGLKLVAQLDSELSYTAIRAALSEHGRLIKQFAFSSDRKMMSTIAELPDGRVRVFTTGGSDMVLSRCTRMARLDAAGARLEPLALNESRVADIITRIITPMAQQSLRTIAVAYRDFPNRALVPPSVEEFPEQDLMLYGILGIKDPLRAGVVQAVATANRAGVRVRMVTGDNKITATAVRAHRRRGTPRARASFFFAGSPRPSLFLSLSLPPRPDCARVRHPLAARRPRARRPDVPHADAGAAGPDPAAAGRACAVVAQGQDDPRAAAQRQPAAQRGEVEAGPPRRRLGHAARRAAARAL
jgi:calcium-translocating P-type ATPase